MDTLNYSHFETTITAIRTMYGDQSTIMKMKEKLEIAKKLHANLSEKFAKSERAWKGLL